MNLTLYTIMKWWNQEGKKSMQDMSMFDSYFKASKSFLCVMCVQVVRNECYDQ